jgi:Na+-driven multidrug efflux pump
VATGTAVVTAAWMFLAYFAPVHGMTKLLGPTWPQARHIVIYAGLCFVIASWSGVGAAGLRALRAAKTSLYLAVVLIPFLIVPPLVGAKLHGLVGAAFGAVISNVFICVATWVVLIWATRKVEPIPEPPSPALDAALAA